MRAEQAPHRDGARMAHARQRGVALDAGGGRRRRAALRQAAAGGAGEGDGLRDSDEAAGTEGRLEALGAKLVAKMVAKLVVEPE